MAKRRKRKSAHFNRRALALAVLGTLAAAGWRQHVLAASRQSDGDAAFPGRLPITELTEDEAILHALNRLAFGPRPGDIERVKQMGLENWIEMQLNPQRIDDSALEARLKDYHTLTLSSAELMKEYPQPKKAQQAKLQEQQAGLAAARGPQPQGAPLPSPAAPPSITAAAPNVPVAAAGAAGAPATASPVANDMSGEMSSGNIEPGMASGAAADDNSMSGQNDMSGQNGMNAPLPAPAAPPPPQLTVADLKRLPKPQQIIAELSAAKMTRAIYSERQLQEVLDDFWFNHFNVFAGKNEDRWLLTSYERDTIRPHVLDKFEDLLVATAKSPAMLVYLDNFQSADPDSFARTQQGMYRRLRILQAEYGPLGMGMEMPPPPGAQPRGPKRGLNENYGRELMELHTVGVESGYTQDDVTAAAKVLTGWTIKQPRVNPQFYFEDRLHDPHAESVLGKKISGGGIHQGEQLLDMLAHYRTTAHFISEKLAERFVSDQPPAALVDRMAETFRKSDGDIRAVMRTMIYSPEFWSRAAYRAKIKSPFELVVSTARALGVDTENVVPLVQWTNRMGEPLYQCQPPNGYSDKAETWVNTGALLDRMNFAMAIAGNRRRFESPQFDFLTGQLRGASPEDALAQFVNAFLGGEISQETMNALKSQLMEPQTASSGAPRAVPRPGLTQIAGLVLGSPEFQRR